MKRIAAIACLVLALPWAAALAADQKPDIPARVARYYAADLEPALIAMRVGTMLISECADRFASECTAGQKRAAAGKESGFELLDLLTLFPLRVNLTAGVPSKTYAQLRERLATTSDLVLSQAASYDLRLFARYGATLRACPPKDVAEWRESLQSMQAIDLKHFMRLTKEQLDSAVEQMVLEEIQLAEVIQRDWAPGECAAAQETGLTLLQYMYTKLEPWMPGAEYPDGSDVRRGAAGDFVQSVAIELEMMVNPGVREQILAIGKRRSEARSRKP
jgi:hypothetical protein